ncbi:MAG: PEP-CTERM sorting domain-containing protein [Moorea sp. SIOASIH]|uniref:hypothetical protein n=1 Tax=Moorena sp. SIOASIH TaxID=2607817 RepID=UPI0013BD8015|nr:hypothetical protein [Moorena sp. SIOASIH]NEO36806.1 PEP-CTERM sorting domain-containing protein [Moorena sp. SIOASIH]
MPNSSLSLFLGVAATALVLTPTTAVAQTFDFNRVENLPVLPIESDSVLSFSGDIANNEGYLAFSNVDPTAPDAGHIGFRPGTDNFRYYILGPGRSPDPARLGTRSATLEGVTGLPNFFNYLNENDIPLSSIGLDFGPKSDRDVTKTWNLGEDQLGQDWFGSPDSPIEESIYQANPDDVENFLTFGTTKIINFGYTPFYFVSANDNPGTPIGNFNNFWSNPIPAFKAPGLDPLASGLADAFLQDVAAGGGLVQEISIDQPEPSDLSFSVSQGFEIITLSYPLEIRIVGSTSVPEGSSVLGLFMLGALGTVARMTSQKLKQ